MKRPESYCQKDQIYGSPIYSSCFFSFQYNTKVYDDIKKLFWEEELNMLIMTRFAEMEPNKNSLRHLDLSKTYHTDQ